MSSYDYNPPSGMSREEHQEWTTARKERIAADRKLYEELRNVSHAIVTLEIKAGRLSKASAFKCVDCGNKAQCYDHRDYREPLKVEAVCRGCNNRRGRAQPYPDLPRRFYQTRKRITQAMNAEGAAA